MRTHKLRNHPMENNLIIIPLLNQPDEILHCFRNEIGE